MEKNMRLNINFDELNNFCEINNFILVNNEMLKVEGMYKNFVYSTENNFIGKSVYPKDMPIIINKEIFYCMMILCKSF